MTQLFLDNCPWKNCWTLGSTLPVCFLTWTNCLLWILTLAIVAETNAYEFWSNDNRDYYKWNQNNRSQVRNSLGSHWGRDWTLGSVHPVCLATWTNCLWLILTLAIVVETNPYRFYSNRNRDFNKNPEGKTNAIYEGSIIIQQFTRNYN